MTSRLDRLFALLENCRNASVRAAAAQQLGELVQNLPSNLENVLNRLIPLLRSRSWVSRLAAADVIRSIVHNLPSWDPLRPVDPSEPACAATPIDKDGFLSLRDLRLDRVLAQGARLYSMDARELERPIARSRSGSQASIPTPGTTIPAADSSNSPRDVLSENGSTSTLLVQRHELNSRLGLEDDNVITKVLAQHSDVSASHWISPEDLADDATGNNELTPQQDVANSVLTAYRTSDESAVKRSASTEHLSSMESSKRSRLDHQDENCRPLSITSPQQVKVETSTGKGWPLDHFCTLLLGDLWALRWETRHGAASGLRELLAENRHTKHCGKRTDMSEVEMELNHSRYLEDIVVRVLCTLALDQLSDFISDEVVSPVRETAAQLLGVLSLHLSAEQVVLVAKHLVYLVTLETHTTGTQSSGSWKNSWMIVHGGLLGIKYLLASRKDLRSTLLPLITPCLIGQLNTEPVKPESSTNGSVGSGADEDLRAASASALLPIVDADWCSITLGTEQTKHLLDRIWTLLGTLTSDLSPSTGPLLQLVSVLIKANPDLFNKRTVEAESFSSELHTVVRLLHHVSSGIRQHALTTLRCLLDAVASQTLELAPPLLLLVVDQLFHRIILEPTGQVRSKATELCITVVQRADLSVLARACVERLDFWLCQAMQPVGVPYPPQLFAAQLMVPCSDQAFLHNMAGQQAPIEADVDGKDTDQSGSNNCSLELHQLHCIAGSQVLHSDHPETEAFVWETRICALRILSRLFGRLCQYVYPTALLTGAESTEEQPSIICYFLDHLLARLHLTERLAMQRTIAGLILSAWALLPCTECHYSFNQQVTWASQLRQEGGSSVQLKTSHDAALPDAVQREVKILVPKLRAKLESCLTEVVYYEEILGSFKLMQTDCLELARNLTEAGHSQEPLLVANGVRTIAQCTSLLERATQLVSTRQPNPNGSPDSLTVSLDRARATVDRCLSLQLHWGSYVEFGIAAAFVNFGWLLPGRLTLLIRPLMDTIRCVRPGSGISDSTLGRVTNSSSLSPLSPTGTHPAFQRLASTCLTRLLMLEWKAQCAKVNQGDGGQRLPNPSKAATKVVKNLAASLLEADSQLLALKANPEMNLSTTETSAYDVPECPMNVFLDARRSGADAMSVQSSPEASSQISLLEFRRRGTSISLACLCRTFLGSLEHTKPSLDELQLGLPVLWNVLWVDPLRRIVHITGQSVDNFTLKELITDKLCESLKQPITQADEEVISTGLISLIVCIPALLPCITEATQPSFEFLVHHGTLVSCLPRPKIQLLGARLLATLAIHRTVPLFNLLLPIVLPLLEPRVTENGVRLTEVCKTMLNSITVVIDHLTNVSPDSSTTLIPIDNSDPLNNAESDFVTEDRYCQASESLSTNICSSSQLPEALRSFLPYMVLFVPPVLRLLADQDENIRESAGRLFALLLSLFPLESSLPDAKGMDQTLSLARIKERRFIDSLLHPEHIQLYNLPVPINAHLRPYQQDGINWLNFLNRYGLNGILCDDLGLGKTLQTICILAGSHHELQQQQRSALTSSSCSGFNSPISLVVCPSTLCGHWLHEVQQFVQSESLVPVIYSGGPSVRQNLQDQIFDYNLVITSYDLVRNDIQFFQSIFWNYVVLDEGHIIKSSKSKVTRALKQLRAQHRLILTGTPIQNRVCELWSLFDFLMPDFLGTESSFSARFARPVAASRDPKASRADQRAGHLALEKLHRLVLPFMLRRLKEDVMADLPPKIIQDFACEMTAVQVQLYEAFTKSTEGQRLLRSVGNVDQSVSNRSASGMTNEPKYGFQALRYLQAVCNHPCLALKHGHPDFSEVKRTIQSEFGPNTALNSVQLSGKLLGLCRLLTDCGFGTPNFTGQLCSTSQSSTAQSELDDDRTLLSQHRALIFFQTREMLQLTEDMLRSHFPWITSARLDGQVPVSERHNRVMRFNQDPSIDIMLLTTAVGGLGLNLTGADTVIFVEHDWNPSKDLQAMDRAHRIGQKRTVSVYRLITQDSIEEQIMNFQAFKLHLANTVVTTENRSLTGMDTEHLLDRFTDTSHPGTDSSAGVESLDSMERCYELEYNLDAFVSRLKSLT